MTPDHLLQRQESVVVESMSVSRQIIGLVGWLLLCFAAAALGAFASAGAGAFYGQLLRPGWAPPAWLFAPVWTVLYALMGISAWLVWRERRFKEGKNALVLFVLQLAANALWTWIFFTWNQGATAFAEILLLWCLIVATVAAFWRLHALAAVIMLPYLAWVTFAAALTFSTWQRNPDLL
jgi:tryptophan-rich sensory protein